MRTTRMRRETKQRSLSLIGTVQFCAWRAILTVLLAAAPLASAPAVSAQSADTEPGIILPGEARTRALEDLAMLDRCRTSAPRSSPALLLQQLRSQYLLAVDSEDALGPAQNLLDALERTPWARSAEGRPVVEGYRGALRTLEARHGFWPTRRIRDLREGFLHLDNQVAATPNQVEVRYLRLMSAAFLPSIFGRGEIARGDLEALGRQLPAAAGTLPERTWTLMADAVEALLRERNPGLARSVAPEFQRARSSARVAAIPLLPTGCPASEN
jgi:hypothetical protein